MELRNEVLNDVSISLLSEGKSIRISAWGYSMYPAIRPGDIINISPCKKGTPAEAGMVVARKRKGGLVVHRLTEVNYKGGSRTFITRGDSCLRADEPFGDEELAGIVVSVERGKKEVVVRPEGPIRYRFNNRLVYLLMVRRKLYSILGRIVGRKDER